MYECMLMNLRILLAQKRSVLKDALPSGLDCVVNGEDVVAIDSDCRHAVSGSTCSDSVSTILLLRRR